MIRPVLAVLGLGLAAAFVWTFAAPGLRLAPRGEPMLVAAQNAPELQPVNLDRSACEVAALIGAAPDHGAAPSLRIVTITTDGTALRPDAHVAEIPVSDGTGAIILLFVDEDGELLSAANVTAREDGGIARVPPGCAEMEADRAGSV